ncbi:MAG TPA: VWA domain-containing protein [Bacilli bacterium]|jgi:hypothetical protein|nr:VWA domain-containing protein [Acholeplasmataceae bacterium]HNZ77318.1 VWA domain-containing protein [Bacilli bacterium]HOD60661.1 VWA domain-containing protein [Bacilli bacterium]HOE06285.1 VWA domain-containing protein [Bacilli bacterium]HOH60946.1 VWA domain-containing protein [Bacilli bacterium]
MKKIFLMMSLFLLIFLFVGCKQKVMEDATIDAPTGMPSDTVAGKDFYDGSLSPDVMEGEVEPKEEGSPNFIPQAGQISASEWSDLKNYRFWLSLFTSGQDSKEGLFTEHFQKGYFDTLNMIEVVIKNGEEKVSGAKVELLSENQEVLYTSITNANGKAYLFPATKEITTIKQIGITVNNVTTYKDYTYSKETNVVEYDIKTSNTKEKIIEIMFVVDTTGSMGDEISYLKAEIDYVISSAKRNHQEAEVRLALLFYRDFGDEYVTRYFDFSTNIEEQKKNLAAQNALGGGDWEEAVDVALEEAVTKKWSEQNTTKLLFHVLDAPPHYEKDIMTRYANAIQVASSKGIRMIPVASSGIDKYTEYLLRNEAMMTGGTYTYITNHSGIGDEHIEATVGETVVEYLNMMLIRIISEYYTGIEQEKVPYYQK